MLISNFYIFLRSLIIIYTNFIYHSYLAFNWLNNFFSQLVKNIFMFWRSMDICYAQLAYSQIHNIRHAPHSNFEITLFLEEKNWLRKKIIAAHLIFTVMIKCDVLMLKIDYQARDPFHFFSSIF